MKLYENIKKYRNERGLSQERLAELMGYSVFMQLSRIELSYLCVFESVFATCVCLVETV